MAPFVTINYNMTVFLAKVGSNVLSDWRWKLKDGEKHVVISHPFEQ